MLDMSAKKRRFNKNAALTVICYALAVAALGAAAFIFISKPSKVSETVKISVTEAIGDAVASADKAQEFDVSDGAKPIYGKNDVLEITNYQSFYDTIGKSGTFLNDTDVRLPLNTMSAVVTAKDGETYMAFQNFETEDGSNTTFTLYRLEEEGWAALASADVSNGYLPAYGLLWSSPIYLATDAESNVHAVTLLDNMIVIYSYDKANNVLVKNVSPYYFGRINYMKSFSSYCDEKAGDAGAIYVSCVCLGSYSFIKYDIATNKFEVSSNLTLATARHSNRFTVSNGVIYLLAAKEYEPYSKLCLFEIYDAFGPQRTYKRIELLDSKKLINENDNIGAVNVSVSNVGTNGEGIHVDKGGNVHVIASISLRYNGDLVYDNIVTYFKIDAKGNVFSNAAQRLCDGENIKDEYFGGFIAVGDELYYAELYEGDLDTVAIGRISDNGAAELVDTFEIPDNVNKNNGFMIKTNGRNVLFCSMESMNMFFFQIESR